MSGTAIAYVSGTDIAYGAVGSFPELPTAGELSYLPTCGIPAVRYWQSAWCYLPTRCSVLTWRTVLVSCAICLQDDRY
eukprot:3940808-Rhodomonas_salina.7